MANKLMQPTWDPLVLAAQLQKIARQSQTVMQRFLSNQPDAIKLGIGDTSGLRFDFLELMTKMMINPAAVASAQIDLFNDTLSVWQKTAERMLMLRAHEADAPKDKRFKHPEMERECHLQLCERELSRCCEVDSFGSQRSQRHGRRHPSQGG